jgi:menaquinone-dependent protoporphyrinogen oxidase
MHVLVTFATRHGSTRAIAETIVAELETVGHTTSFVEAGHVSSLDRYDAVVVGSGVYFGKWLEPARNFLTTWSSVLEHTPVWTFSSGPVGDQAAELPPELASTTRTLSLQGHTVFGGFLDVSKLGIGERLITKIVRAPEGDHRDWEAIRMWARQIGTELNAITGGTATAPAQESA